MEELIVFTDHFPSDAEIDEMLTFHDTYDTASLPSEVDSIKNEGDYSQTPTSGYLEVAGIDCRSLKTWSKPAMRLYENDSKVAILLNKLQADDWDDILTVFDGDSGNYTPFITFPQSNEANPTNAQAYHDTGIIAKVGDKTLHIEPSYHYDTGNTSFGCTLIIKESGPDNNFSEFTRIPLFKDIAYRVASQLEYTQDNVYGNELFLAVQASPPYYDGSTGFPGKLDLLQINVNDGSVIKHRLLDFFGEATNHWTYPHYVYRKDGVHEIFVLVYDQNGSGLRDQLLHFFYDPSTGEVMNQAAYVSSGSGEWSKEIKTSQSPVTYTEAVTNLLLMDTTGGTGEVYPASSHYDAANGKTYLLVGGEDTHSGGTDATFTIKVSSDSAAGYDTYEIPTSFLSTHDIPVGNWTDPAGNFDALIERLPRLIVEDNGDLCRLFVHTDPDTSGNLRLSEITYRISTDTWSFIGHLSTDDTKPHVRMGIAREAAYASRNYVSCSRVETPGAVSSIRNGHPFTIEV